jgi:hypothetical protein
MFPSDVGRERALKGNEAAALLDADPFFQRCCSERDQRWWQQQDNQQQEESQHESNQRQGRQD